MAQVKAIQTQYKGYRFRSRLEARWAVLLDALLLDWTYEPEGYEFPNGSRYLPDFRIPAMRGMLEIKPSSPGTADLSRAIASLTALIEAEEVAGGLIAFGQPSADMDKPDGLSLVRYEGTVRVDLAPVAGLIIQFSSIYPDKRRAVLDYAVKQSRSARFEFGESGPG